MKKTIIILCLISSGIFAQQTQTIQYTYKNGNRVQQKLKVCLNCPNDPQTGRMAAPQDTVQAVIAEHGLNVFPNPTQDKVNLTLSNLKDDEITEAIVTDGSGKILFTQKNLQSRNEINMSNYNNGTYFVRVTMGKDVVVYTVIKVQ